MVTVSNQSYLALLFSYLQFFHRAWALHSFITVLSFPFAYRTYKRARKNKMRILSLQERETCNFGGSSKHTFPLMLQEFTRNNSVQEDKTCLFHQQQSQDRDMDSKCLVSPSKLAFCLYTNLALN